MASAFRAAYEGLGADISGGKSVTMQKIWHLIQVATSLQLGSKLQFLCINIHAHKNLGLPFLVNKKGIGW